MSKVGRGTAILGLSAGLIFGGVACGGESAGTEPTTVFSNETIPPNTFQEDCDLAIQATEYAYRGEFGPAWDAVVYEDVDFDYHIDNEDIRRRVGEFASDAALAYWADALIASTDLDELYFPEFEELMSDQNRRVAIELESYRRRNNNPEGIAVLQTRSDELDAVLEEAWQTSDGGREFCGTNPDLG